MTGRLAILAGACALALLVAAPARAAHWPLFGGDASRSGAQAADAAEAPIVAAWAKAGGDAAVRTPIVITGGGGPAVQRVAYGTSNFHVHLQALDTGAPVGPEEGVRIEDGTSGLDSIVFGDGDLGASVGFADTSTADRPGQLLVVHNDDGGVYIARFDLATGARNGADIAVADTVGCAVNGSPVLTPPDDKGGRFLFFTISPATGTCPSSNTSLVRVPIHGDAASLSAVPGDPRFVPVVDLNPVASPTLAVLNDPETARPRFYVAVARTGGLSFFPADVALSDQTPPAAVEPPITATLGAGEVAQTPAVPATAAGLVAGAEGSGTPKAPAVYVATAAGADTKVYRLEQQGSAKTLAVAAGATVAGAAPSSAMALSETMAPAGISPNGRLVLAASTNLWVLDTRTLSVVSALSAAPLTAGDGFSRTVPAVSGPHVFVARDGDAGRVPRRLVRRLDNLQVVADGFDEANQADTGVAWGQPALSRGFAVFGSAGGAFAHRARDATPPQVEILDPPAGTPLAGTVELVARAGDARGLASVLFRIGTEGGSVRSVGRDPAPGPGSPMEVGPGQGARYGVPFQTASVTNGEYILEVLVTDSSGLSASAKRRLRIQNEGGSVPELRPGACANERTGTPGPDRMVGGPTGDRLLGGPGNDRLSGGGGHDCLLGQEGDDSADGGSGDDLLDGGVGIDVLSGAGGRDMIAGQAGRDRLSGGIGDDRLNGGLDSDSLRGGAGNDILSGGAGNDTLRGDAGRDRLSGGPGNDVLSGGASTNRLDGGAGNDRINARNARRDVVVCGRGRDRVEADGKDRVSSSCERIRRR